VTLSDVTETLNVTEAATVPLDLNTTEPANVTEETATIKLETTAAIEPGFNITFDPLENITLPDVNVTFPPEDTGCTDQLNNNDILFEAALLDA